MNHDIFYKMKYPNPEKAKEIIRWANENGVKTEVTLLDFRRSMARIPADKDFDTVVDLIGSDAAEFLRVILRTNMNLYGRLTDRSTIDELLEIGIRSIEVDSKEYFITIFLDRGFLDMLIEKYELECISGGV